MLFKKKKFNMNFCHINGIFLHFIFVHLCFLMLKMSGKQRMYRKF